jgi:DNA helicase-2/ATP-dependent DNA helicase PcrA
VHPVPTPREWAAVFLVGAEEGLLPHARTLDDREPDALRAELRLAYVAVTRARRWLWITHCRTRSTGGAPAPRRLSRFLRALPGELLAPGDRAA